MFKIKGCLMIKKDKYLSIITNFGCHWSCPYCVVKNNNLDIPVTRLEDIDNIKDVIKEHKCNIISISGGGDPLWNYNQNKDYYNKLFNLIGNIRLEMHTSLINNQFPKNKLYRIVYHLQTIEQLYSIQRYDKEIVRVVFVVNEQMTVQDIDYIYNFVKNNSNNIDELSFRQMINNKYQPTYYNYNHLMNGHQKKWWYIQQGDYNLYYCGGKVYTKYSDIGLNNEIKA